MRVLLGVVLLGLAVGPAAAPAAEGECGGGVPCRCGDALRGTYELTADLGPCEGDGLVLRAAAVLDCHGHRIFGPESRPLRRDAEGSPKVPEKVGITLNRTQGAVVRDCKVTGFDYGIRLSEAEHSQVIGGEVYRNGDARTHVGYGIHLSRSTDNTVRGCHVHDNADEGIHIGNAAHRNTLVDNHAHDNFRENYYVIEASGTRLLNNRGGGGVSSNLYMKHATRSRIEANRFDARPVLVRGRSSENVFLDNTFAAGLKFEVLSDDATAVPSENLVRGGRIAGPSPCLTFAEARNNRLEDVVLQDCGNIAARATAHAVNYLSGVDLKHVGLDLSGNMALQLATPVRIEVRSEKGRPIPDARLELRDRRGDVHDAPSTDAAGRARCPVPIREAEFSGARDLTPVVLTVSAKGYAPGRAVIKNPLPETLRLVLETAR